MRIPTVSKAASGLLFAALTAVLAVGCEGTPGEGEGEGEGEGCTIDRDCGGGSICDKTNDGDDIPAADDPEGVCVRIVCISNDDCGDNEICDLRRGICVPENLCDPSDANACSDGEKCQYVDGLPLCAAPPAAAGCDLSPSKGFLSVGGSLEFEGVGTDASGKLVPHTTFGFSATGGTMSGTVFTADTAGDATVTGTTANGGATCTASVKVYPAVAAADLRVVVIDQAARAPISGAKVAIKLAGVDVEATTDADGAATFTGGALATSVSAFPDNHQWHTILSPGNDVVVYTAPVQNDPAVDGIKGGFDFSKVKTRGDIQLGLAGLSINAAITDLNFNTIIGELKDTAIDIEGITEPGGQVVPLPEGLVIGLGEEQFKADYVALTDKSGGGVAWALAGRVALSEVGPIISSVAGSDDLDFGAILGAILPFFAKFDHAVVTGLDFSVASPRNDGNFESVTITPNTLMGLSANLTMPTLPCAPGAFANGSCSQAIFLLTEGENSTVVTECPAGAADCVEIAPFTSGAVVLSGVVVPGQGLVPLGITAGLDVVGDEEADGIAAQAGDDAPNPGTLLLDYAPPHDGIEGNIYVTVAIALDINQITSADDLGASIITKVSRTLPEASNSFASGFLQSQGGSFTPGAAGSFTLDKKGNASFYRVNLDDNGEQEWNVWFADETSFNIADLAQHSGVDVSARTVHADVQAFTLGAGYDGEQPADFDALFAFDGQDIDNLLYYLGAWSSESCKAGGICATN